MKSVSNRIVAGVVVALAGVGCTTTQGVKPDPDLVNQAPKRELTAEESFAEGVKLFDAGKLEEAQKTFAAALQKNPQLVAAQYNLGVIAERQGDLIGAEKAYEGARQLEPNHGPTLLNLGKVYRLMDKFDQAIVLYEAALKEPGKEFDVALLNNLTVAYRLAKKFDLAEATARKVLSRTKDNPDAYKNLALIYYDQGNYRLAEFISANAKKLDDKDPGVYNNLGMIYLKLDDRRGALGQFKKAVSLDEKFAPGHMNIGAMALSYRDYETAESSFAKAVTLEPNSYEGHLAYAYALDGQRGRDSKKGLAAAAEFEKVLSLKPEHPEAICGAGWSYSSDKSGYERAITFLEKCKTLPSTSAQDQQLIEVKLKGLAAMLKSGAAAPKPDAQEREKPKAEAGGAALLDKVANDAAQQDPPAETTPSDAQPAPPTAPETK